MITPCKRNPAVSGKERQFIRCTEPHPKHTKRWGTKVKFPDRRDDQRHCIMEYQGRPGHPPRFHRRNRDAQRCKGQGPVCNEHARGEHQGERRVSECDCQCARPNSHNLRAVSSVIVELVHDFCGIRRQSEAVGRARDRKLDDVGRKVVGRVDSKCKQLEGI